MAKKQIGYLKPKKIADSQNTMMMVMSPMDANHYGYVHGGAIMRYVDEAAFISASRHSGRNTVTASIDQMGFHNPVHLGDLLILKSAVNYAGKTSMEVGIRIETENPVTGETKYVGSAYVTMVALDDLGKPTKIPRLIYETALEKERAEKAEKRRAFRLKMRKKSVKGTNHVWQRT